MHMWHELFSLTPSIAEKVVRAAMIYVFLIAALRVGGKRELGQLNTLDFIVLLTVANAVQNGIIGNDNSVTGAVIGATTLFVINGIAAIATFRSPTIHRLLIGTPAVLIEDGEINHRNVRRERISDADLSQAITDAGGSDTHDVERCVLETNGHIAVTLRSVDPNATRFDEIRRRLAEIEARLG